jgi:hypothetical protein
MKVFVSGATGVLGRRVVPRLVAVGRVSEIHSIMNPDKLRYLSGQLAAPSVR